MSSRSEYLLNMSKEFAEISTFHLIATGLSLFVFVSVLVLFVVRHQDRDQSMSHLPFND